MLKKGLVFVLLMLLLQIGFAQYSNLHESTFVVADSVIIDSVPIIEQSLILRVEGEIIADSMYSVNHKKSTIYFTKLLVGKHAEALWRTYHPVLTQVYAHKNPSLLTERKKYSIFTENKDRFSVFPQSEIDRSGSISRGFTVGNNQDVTMSSSLNLQLSGKLTENLWVAASITDANIPVQPDGNTQQLQEFDQIFIRVYNEKINLIVGDYNLERPTGLFLNVNKKLQGIQFKNTTTSKSTEKPKTTFKNNISGAVSKGKYFRQLLIPIEGNQGPYKLRGANNERFIIIIAGSERVVVDGETWQRGEQYDYTIDYNSAEIRFNTNRPISTDMRMYVEFEYTDRNYTRFLVSDFAEFERGKTRFWFNVISESDAQNQPIDLELTTEMTDILATAGDNTNNAIVPNISEQAYDENMILYAQRDSTIDGITHTMYYQSYNPDSAIYRLGFSLLGDGNGNYVQLNNLTNGKVYKWVAPIDGEKQGSYEPVVQLVAPQSHQLINTGIEIKHSKQSISTLEVAWSRFDKNTFSTLDANDNMGTALNYKGKHLLAGDSVKNLFIESGYQYVQAHFNEFERFRTAEFSRDWNVGTLNLANDQHMAGLSMDYAHGTKTSINIGAQTLVVPQKYQGINSTAKLSHSNNWINTSGNYSFLKTLTDSISSEFLRAKTHIGIPFWKMEAGVRQDLEQNAFKNESGNLISQSYQYFSYETYIKNTLIENIEAELTANYRIDNKTVGETFKPVKERKGITLQTEINQNSKSTWNLVANYRKVRIINDSVITAEIPDQHVSARIENRSVLFDGIARTTTFYEVTTGLESKKDYAYLEVEKGQGNYVWIDRNENGIKEINEFEISPIASEGDHIRMFIPTDEYISVYSNQFKQSVNLNFRKFSVSKKGALRVLALFSDQLSFAVNRKVGNKKFSTYANPFLLNDNDSTLIATSQSIRNVFSFNKIHPKFGADFIYMRNIGKSLLTNGFEGRGQEQFELQLRWNMTRYITLLNNVSTSEKSKTTEFFTANNYTITNQKADNVLRIQPASAYRFELKYTFDKKDNLRGSEMAIHHDGGLGFNYAAAQKSTLEISAHYIDVKFHGEGNNSLTYELLNGLQKGANYTWEMQWNRQLAKNFQMSIAYNGRAGEDIKTIHIGTMRVRAMF